MKKRATHSYGRPDPHNLHTLQKQNQLQDEQINHLVQISKSNYASS